MGSENRGVSAEVVPDRPWSGWTTPSPEPTQERKSGRKQLDFTLVPPFDLLSVPFKDEHEESKGKESVSIFLMVQGLRVRRKEVKKAHKQKCPLFTQRPDSTASTPS